MSDGWTSFTVSVRDELKNQWEEYAGKGNMSSAMRTLMRGWCEADQKYGLSDEFENMDIVVLKTYKTAVEKNISLLEQKKAKLQEHIDQIEEEGEDDVLVEVSIDLEGRTL